MEVIKKRTIFTKVISNTKNFETLIRFIGNISLALLPWAGCDTSSNLGRGPHTHKYMVEGSDNNYFIPSSISPWTLNSDSHSVKLSLFDYISPDTEMCQVEQVKE